MHQTGTYLQRRELCPRLWQTETRCQTAVDKPSLRETNFHSRCHGSSIFCCLEDTIFRRVQLHAGVTVWEDKWRSSLSFLFPQPSMAPLCLGNNRGETFEKLHVWLWKVFLRCVDVKATSVFAATAAVESKYLQMQSKPKANLLMFPNLSSQSVCVFMQTRG